MYEQEQEDGRTATLNEPYLGYRNIELIRMYEHKWLVRIIESGKEIEVYEDDFIIN